MTNRILLIEDEEKIARFTELELRHEGYEVEKAFSGRTGLELAESGRFDLVLLDVMLPELNGLEVLRRLRRSSDVPVILLTAKDAVSDKVSGLDAGADDYITKPFAIEELLARIRVIVRNKAREEKVTAKIEAGGVTVDTDRHEVTCQGTVIDLNNREYELVKTLITNKNIVLNREQLLRDVCGYTYMGESNIIDVYVRYIRAKIDDRFQIKFITTVRGVGYVVKED